MSRIRIAFAAAAVATSLLSARIARAQTIDWSAVDAAFGRPGAAQAGNVRRYNFPRSDLDVHVGGVKLEPALALGGWIAFLPTARGQALAMGDLVLLDTEVGPVMAALQSVGIGQSALHNHLLNETPHVMYMHVTAEGDPTHIAQAIRSALGRTATPLGTPARPAPASAANLDTAGIARALGLSGHLNGDVYQLSVPRRETITEMGHTLPPSMGVATGINFQPTGGGRAAITGDFVLLGGEVNPVIHALTSAGIAVTAVHSHLIDESPRLYFMHFWANDDAVKLARGVRAALDQTTAKR
jgi:hypothetical protein